MPSSPESSETPTPAKPLCVHCGKTLATYHGAFARCAGGATQFTPPDDDPNDGYRGKGRPTTGDPYSLS